MRFRDDNSFSKKQFLPTGLKVGIIILVILSFFFLNSSFSINIRSFFYSMSMSSQRWLWEKGDNLSDFWIAVFKTEEIKTENERLVLENQKLIAEKINLEYLKEENEVLRTAFDIELQKDFELEISQVIAKEASRDYLIINKGSKDGVKFGLPVITEEKVLVGKIIEVYEDTSRVQLSTAKDNSFDVEVLERDIYGLVEGEGNLTFSLGLIPKEKEINIADKVITSVLGGNFPKGLLVGEVQRINSSDVASFQEAELNPSFNIKELNYLFIIISNL
jgi:rod shape-determining protein MreC